MASVDSSDRDSFIGYLCSLLYIGAEVDSYTYSPYGEAGAQGDSGFPFRFTGQKLDPATGLYNYKNRWYDPETGRFLQTDPIGYADGMNMYAYVGGDPINFTDPTGLRGFFAQGIGVVCFTEACDNNLDVGSHREFNDRNRGGGGGGSGFGFGGFGNSDGSADFGGPAAPGIGGDSAGGGTPGAPQRIRLQGANKASYNGCDARNEAAKQAQDFQERNDAELTVGLYSQNGKWGYTDGRTTWERGRSAPIPGSYVPPGGVLRGSVHSHPDNFQNRDWRTIPLNSSNDGVYVSALGGKHYVVTPDGDVRRIQSLPSGAFYVQAGNTNQCV